MPIPKFIVQTWKTDNLHIEIQQKIINFLKKNPGYDYKMYNDESIDKFVNKHYPGEIADCYNRLNIIVAKVDFWRYLVLYKYGGIYLDMDADILDSLDKLIRSEDDAIITAEGNPGLFVQWGLMFSAGHPILKRVIDIVTFNIKTNRYPNDIHKMTGPTAFTEAINSIHSELFGAESNLYSTITTETDTTYEKDGIKYRVYSKDYGKFMHYTHDSTRYLYTNVTHWRQQEKMRPLLKDGVPDDFVKKLI